MHSPLVMGVTRSLAGRADELPLWAMGGGGAMAADHFRDVTKMVENHGENHFREATKMVENHGEKPFS
jgi:hypothetical protein